MRPSQNIPLPPSQNIPPFATPICHPPRIYPIFNNYMRPSQNLTLPPRKYPLPFSYYVRPSQYLPLPPRIYRSFQHLYATLPQSTPPSHNIPPFQQLGATLPESTHPSWWDLQTTLKTLQVKLKQEHTQEKPAAIIELKVIAPTRSNYWHKMKKIAINRPFWIFFQPLANLSENCLLVTCVTNLSRINEKLYMS